MSRMQKKKKKKKKAKILTVDNCLIPTGRGGWGAPVKDKKKKGRNVTLEVHNSHIT